MVRGLYTNWKQPFAYMLSSGPVKSEILHILLQESIACLLQIGLCPKAIVCDQGSNNRAVLKKMNVTTPNPFVISNDSHKMYVFMDPPHLIKNIRNNLKTHGFTLYEQPVLWSHIQQFYDHDSELPIRLAPKLTKRHIELPNFAKLKVSLAVQVLSHTVAAGISTMVSFKALPPDATATAQLVEKFDQLFNCFNNRRFNSTSTMAHALTDKSGHIQFLQHTKEWLLQLKCRNKTQSLPCLEGWLLSISALEQLWSDLSENFGFPTFS
ncbi:transposable element p transposase [Plakobranchus ocellatus]|uniref:Transposable element p transposase n=1 Tax=Plakobranchus ocellatus TaxID=259542 RepID=A0AAV3XR46_9GAST|nr:transposable element p transposase [Plakobranchus ocellatus]